jgi:hypothetical protein
MQAAEKAMGFMLKLPDSGRTITKQQSRSAFAAAWREQLDAEAEMGFTQLQVGPPHSARTALRLFGCWKAQCLCLCLDTCAWFCNVLCMAVQRSILCINLIEPRGAHSLRDSTSRQPSFR